MNIVARAGGYALTEDGRWLLESEVPADPAPEPVKSAKASK